VFDYLNTDEATLMWNTVRTNVRLQLWYVEDAFGVQNQLLQRWWDLFTEEYFALVQRRARDWADQALNLAGAPFMEAHNAGRTRQQHNAVMMVLQNWRQNMDQRLSTPARNFNLLPGIGDGSGSIGVPGNIGRPGGSDDSADGDSDDMDDSEDSDMQRRPKLKT
jgi:chitinase